MALIILKICLHIKDTISKNLLPLLKESISLQKLLIDGDDFYSNYNGWEKFERKEQWEIVYSDQILHTILSLNDGEWTLSAEMFNQGHGSVLQYSLVWLYMHTSHGWLPLRLGGPQSHTILCFTLTYWP